MGSSPGSSNSGTGPKNVGRGPHWTTGIHSLGPAGFRVCSREIPRPESCVRPRPDGDADLGEPFSPANDASWAGKAATPAEIVPSPRRPIRLPPATPSIDSDFTVIEHVRTTTLDASHRKHARGPSADASVQFGAVAAEAGIACPQHGACHDSTSDLSKLCSCRSEYILFLGSFWRKAVDRRVTMWG